MVTLEEIKKYLNVKDSLKDEYFTSMIPVATGFIEKETGLNFTDNPFLMDETLKFIASKMIEFFMLKSGVKSKSISRANYSYMEDMPTYILSVLEKYKKDENDHSKGNWSFI